MKQLLNICLVICGCCIFRLQAYRPINTQYNNGLQQQQYQPQEQNQQQDQLFLYQHIIYNNANQPGFSSETANPNRKYFEIVNEWKYLDFEYLTYEQRKRAIENR